ncbi:ABC transporter permease [Pontibacter lucknowensis]|uniref:Putative ABC transport system permease protein n=2 Tax=Pontibacter TaxID=323449 RepID=A0A1N6YCY3_9BACT|nr:ABC transporter permease [Pontibacter lucknowensis]SIR12359.1 putative ABC transport system permease protein [Pontibacter lucknowensis]
MLKNYWLTSWRSITRNRVHAAINIIGLAVGIASCILIYLFLQHELSYDQSFSDADRLYRVTSDMSLNGQAKKTALSHGPLAQTLTEEYPEVEQATFLLQMGQNSLRSKENALTVGISYADSNFFKVLPFPFVAGDPATALQNPFSVVVTEELARKYFGSADSALGKPLTYIASTFLVTGVISHPRPSHLQIDAVFPLHFDTNTEYMLNQWQMVGGYTYLKLFKAEQAGALTSKMPELYNRKAKPNQQMDGIAVTGYNIQPITDAYLDKDLEYPVGDVGNITYIYIFSVIAVFILLIATINYINLATARSAKRSKEVGLRKTIGASRSQLVKQFLAESFMLTLIAVVVALSIVELILPLFNSLTERSIDTIFILKPEVGLFILGIVIFVSFMAGGYPALYLSGYKPVEALKANATPNSGNARLRKALVVLQFTISLILIIGTVVVYNQMQHLKGVHLGFQKEHVISVKIPSIGWVRQKEKLALLKKEMLELPQIAYTSSAQQLPGEDALVSDFQVEINHKMVTRTINHIGVDYSYIDLMGIKLAEGRGYSREIRSDETHSYLINEAAAREFGWTDALDKRIKLPDDTLTSKVIGVVKDFNYKSLHSKIEPLIIRLEPHFGRLLTRVNTEADLSATLADMDKVWKKHFPAFPMDYQFLDESFQQQYRAEEKMLIIFTYFTILTIVIACLGLFGLSAYMAEQRTKEIGIRIVLGSSVSEIVLLLSRSFALLVLIAIVMAIPIAWFSMDKWLQNFAYRIEISWWVFVTTGLAAMTIALATVSYQAMKAALADPIRALRTE